MGTSSTATQSQFLLYTLTVEETVRSVGDNCRGIFLITMFFEVAAPINLLSKNSSSCNGGESSSRSAEKRSAEEEAADLPTKPTKISKFRFAVGSQTTKKPSAISIKPGSTKPKETVPTLAPKTLSVAAAFNEDEDSEPEERPPEAKMRMKNIGRDTPISAGPNYFNKGKHGFSDNQKLWE
ncbi:PEST proteolytic signal-containing nuclear protein-like [Perognathus longimembris pacificus]|uniref:PEST proteolytic signal-containing nuclear protein-like n=1 Tax=Perognathus longimembris pacificus TaxID=214514 RepID=UPI002019BEB9|nr:PEST proteolytic signal-containing nuclear protein-like [Perognathus longimembris pacificus]